jgi:hypothetical protein
MVVRFTTTYAISDYQHNNGELNRINFVTDFQQVGGFSTIDREHYSSLKQQLDVNEIFETNT